MGPEVPVNRQGRLPDRHHDGRHLAPRRDGARGCRGRARARAVERAFPVGAAQGRDPGRPHHVECRRARAQARDLDHQLHGFRHGPRFDGRHPEQGPRSGPDAEGRLRHRLRILDAAPARGLCFRRRRVHLRADVVHGYLRPHVLHRFLGGRPARRTDGHLRRRSPGRDRLHPRQA